MAAATEGFLLGIPSLAVSLQRTRGEFDFSQAAAAAQAVGREVLAKGLPARTLLNLNVPRARAQGFRITVQARRNHVTSVKESVDPRQRPYFWIEEG